MVMLDILISGVGGTRNSSFSGRCWLMVCREQAFMDPLKSLQFSMDPMTPVPTLRIQSHPNHFYNFNALSEFVF